MAREGQGLCRRKLEGGRAWKVRKWAIRSEPKKGRSFRRVGLGPGDLRLGWLQSLSGGLRVVHGK